MILPILTDDNPILRNISDPISVFDDSLKTLANNLIETMLSANGIGISAIQCGIPKQVIIVSDGTSPIIMINPKIISKSYLKIQHFEGCLSFPNRRFFVERVYNIKTSFQDINGNYKELEAKGLLAACIQHEVSHLMGILLPDIAIKEYVDK